MVRRGFLRRVVVRYGWSVLGVFMLGLVRLIIYGRVGNGSVCSGEPGLSRVRNCGGLVLYCVMGHGMSRRGFLNDKS